MTIIMMTNYYETTKARICFWNGHDTVGKNWFCDKWFTYNQLVFYWNPWNRRLIETLYKFICTIRNELTFLIVVRPFIVLGEYSPNADRYATLVTKVLHIETTFWFHILSAFRWLKSLTLCRCTNEFSCFSFYYLCPLWWNI